MGNDNFVACVGLTELNGEPRAQDLELADRLGFDRPRDIRKLIERNAAELEGFGVCATMARTSGAEGGRPATEYWLNEEQALLVSVLSKAPNAPAVRAMLIKVFVAWRRGIVVAPEFPPDIAEKIDRIFGIERMLAHKVTEIERATSAIPDLVAQSIEAAILSDPRRAVLDYVSVRQILDGAKALQKGRRALNRKVGFALRDRAAQDKDSVAAKCPHTGVWLFKRTFAENFMAEIGASLVKSHNDAVMGQGVLKFVKPGAHAATPHKGS